jgi:ABC-type sugar transport system permease subunit
VFVLAAVLVAWRSVSALAAARPDDVGPTLLAALSIAGQVAACLIGGALFVRHPDAFRTHRALAAGSVLVALSIVGASFRADAGTWLDGLIADEDVSINPFRVAFRTLVSLALAGGLFALGRGLEAARALSSRRRAGRLVLVALAIPVATSAVTAMTFVIIADPGDFLVANVVASAVNLAVGLAWASLAVAAMLGAHAGEEPAAGWWLAATAAWGMLALRLGSALAGWFLMAVPGAVPSAAPNIAIAFPIVESAMWVVLLAAFATGLPASQRPAA